jgi:hypothetical protein
MKTIRIISWIGLGLFAAWGFFALFHTLTHRPEPSRFFFWLVLPYPVLIVFTALLVSTCGRNGRTGERDLSWFAVGLASAASVGLALAMSTGLFSIIRWAYSGDAAASRTQPDAFPVDPKMIAINVAISAAAYIWAGAITATLSGKRPVAHALAAGGILLVWSCAVALLCKPLLMAQLAAGLVLPLPLAAWGAYLQQRRMGQALSQ